LPQWSASELRAAQAAQDWHGLWLQAVPLVKSTISRLIASGNLTPEQATDDLLQEALLTAGRALRTWDPDQGAFTTWMTRAAHGAILDHVRRTMSGMVGGRDAGAPTLPLFEEVTVGHLADAADLLGASQEQLAVRAGLKAMKSPKERELLMRVHGIDREKQNMPQIAAEWFMPLRTIQRLYATAEKKLAGLLKKSR
jgi:RNA polymerase sigma factor (sigma-70 family)